MEADPEALDADAEALEVDPELDSDDGLLAADGAAAAEDPDAELEEGELDDSEEEDAAMPAGQAADTRPEPLTEDARRRRAQRFGHVSPPPQEEQHLTEEARRRRAQRFGQMSPPPPDLANVAPMPMVERPRPGLTPAELAGRRALYTSLGLSEPVDGPVHWRPEAVHVRGTGTMTTGDLMDYFHRFRPAHVEWVSDSSCNVVWMDDVGPTRALLELSSPIAPPKAEKPAVAEEADPDALLVGLDTMDSDAPPPEAQDAPMLEPGEEEAVDPSDIKTPVPLGRWRLGVPHRLTDSLFLRFATRGDRRLPGAEQNRAGHVKLLGDPNHPSGVAGIITERRRRELRGEPLDEPPPPVPVGKPNPWGGIAATWATAEAVRRPVRDYDHDPELSLLRNAGAPPDLRRRLEGRAASAAATGEDRPTAPQPRKRQRSSSPESGSDVSGDSDERQWRTRLKVPRMRMHADDEADKPVKERKPARGDLRGELRAQRGAVRGDLRGDLRSRLGAAGGRRREPVHTSPPRLDYESPDEKDEDGDDVLTADPTDHFNPEEPVNIKITRDFSGDEMSGGESDSKTSDSESSDSGSESEKSGSESGSEKSESESESEEDVQPVEVDVDRRTDKSSAADLRARLNKKRALAKTGRPPLRIEVDNDEYYRVIGSESE